MLFVLFFLALLFLLVAVPVIAMVSRAMYDRLPVRPELEKALESTANAALDRFGMVDGDLLVLCDNVATAMRDAEVVTVATSAMLVQKDLDCCVLLSNPRCVPARRHLTGFNPREKDVLREIWARYHKLAAADALAQLEKTRDKSLAAEMARLANKETHG